MKGYLLSIWLVLALFINHRQCFAAQAGKKMDRYRIDLYTIAPGRTHIYTKWGHSGIRIYDRKTQKIYAYDYGFFRFTSAFIIDYLRGKARFWLGRRTWSKVLRQAAGNDRSIYTQEFRLSAEDKVRFIDHLQEISQSELRFYDYDHFLNNCTTKIRDLVNTYTRGRFRRFLEAIPVSGTLRSEGLAYIPNDIIPHVGLEFLMNDTVDTRITGWSHSFLPYELMRYLDQFRKGTDPIVGPIRLIRRSSVLKRRSIPYRITSANIEKIYEIPKRRYLPWIIFYAVIGAVAIFLFAFPTIRPAHFASGRLFQIGMILWGFVGGLLGTLQALQFLISKIHCFQSNVNILLFHPAILLQPFLFFWLGGKQSLRKYLPYVQIAYIAPIILAAALNISGVIGQPNGGFIAYAGWIQLCAAIYSIRRYSVFSEHT